MLGTDKSRGYCLEMTCADFLAGANLDNENPEVLLQSALRFFKFLPGEERQTFLHHREGVARKAASYERLLQFSWQEYFGLLDKKPNSSQVGLVGIIFVLGDRVLLRID